jgi:hypothetical protein
MSGPRSLAESRILYCHCAYAQVISQQVKDEVLRRLAESGAPFEAVADLCEMSARRDPAFRRLAAPEGRLKIAACFPRAVKWLFAAAGAPLPETAEIHNMRVESAEETAAALLGEAPAPAGEEVKA